jgi:orotate phosphoribosyltransferase
MHILIAEDVVTTGKSSGECAAVLQGLGAKIAALACLVDRRSSDAHDIKWPMFPAIKLPVESWEAGSCEICKKGIPAVKPGSRKLIP